MCGEGSRPKVDVRGAKGWALGGSNGRANGVAELRRRGMVGMIGVLALGFGWGAEALGQEPARVEEAPSCAVASTVAQAEAALDAAELGAREGVGPAEFGRRVDALWAVLLCLGEPVSPLVAAGAHRMEGLRRFHPEHPEDALPSWMAARRARPDDALVSGLDLSATPPGQAFGGLDPATLRPVAAPQHSPHTLYLDGSPAQTWVPTLPTFAQWVAPGMAPENHWLEAKVQLPAPTPLPKRGPHRPLLYSALGSLVVAGGLYGGSFATQASFEQLAGGAGSADQANRLQGLTNGLTIGAGAGLLTGLSLGGAAFLVEAR